MYIKVTKSPAEIPEDFPLDEMDIEAVRFADERGRDYIEMIRELSWELAQTQEYADRLAERLRKHEEVEELTLTPYEHIKVIA